jgi:hypothetical protein
MAGDGGGSEPMDAVLDALADPHRRKLLVALLEHSPREADDRDPFDVLSDAEEPEVLQTNLVHWHLPKLEEMGYITWDRTTHDISKGPKWDEIGPVVELIDEHSDELPDGWV